MAVKSRSPRMVRGWPAVLPCDQRYRLPVAPPWTKLVVSITVMAEAPSRSAPRPVKLPKSSTPSRPMRPPAVVVPPVSVIAELVPVPSLRSVVWSVGVSKSKKTTGLSDCRKASDASLLSPAARAGEPAASTAAAAVRVAKLFKVFFLLEGGAERGSCPRRAAPRTPRSGGTQKYTSDPAGGNAAAGIRPRPTPRVGIATPAGIGRHRGHAGRGKLTRGRRCRTERIIRHGRRACRPAAHSDGTSIRRGLLPVGLVRRSWTSFGSSPL